MNEKRTRKKIAKLKYKIAKSAAKSDYLREIGKEHKVWKQSVKAERFRQKIKKLEQKSLGKEAQSRIKKKRFSAKERAIMSEYLNAIIQIEVPSHMDSGTTSEAIFYLNNQSDRNFDDLAIDLSDMGNYFNVDMMVRFPSLRVGMSIEKRVHFSPKHGDGTFPVIIRISGAGAMIERPYTIKVGGTEIY